MEAKAVNADELAQVRLWVEKHKNTRWECSEQADLWLILGGLVATIDEDRAQLERARDEYRKLADTHITADNWRELLDAEMKRYDAAVKGESDARS